MSGIDFFRTVMGQRFYNHTVPELVRNLGRIADALERLAPPAEAEDERQDPAHRDKP